MNDQESDNELISEEYALLEEFNEKMVEPINHIRKEIYEEDSLSYL